MPLAGAVHNIIEIPKNVLYGIIQGISVKVHLIRLAPF